MLGQIVCDNGKKYPIVCKQKVTIKSVESTRESGCPHIWDLVTTDKNEQLWLWMPDPFKPNYSFLKALESGKRFLLELGEVASWDGVKVTTINLRNHYRQIVTED